MVVFFGGAPGFRYYNLQFVAAYRRVTLARAAHAIGTLAVAGGSMFNMYLSLAAIMQPSSVSYERIQTGSIVSTWLAWGGLVAKLSLDSECESPFSKVERTHVAEPHKAAGLTFQNIISKSHGVSLRYHQFIRMHASNLKDIACIMCP